MKDHQYVNSNPGGGFDNNCSECGGKRRDCVHGAANVYEDLKAAGIPIANHESDLYFPVTEQSTRILSDYPLHKGNATVFTNQVEGGQWYDVPFAYVPWWTRRQKPTLAKAQA